LDCRRRAGANLACLYYRRPCSDQTDARPKKSGYSQERDSGCTPLFEADKTRGIPPPPGRYCINVSYILDGNPKGADASLGSSGRVGGTIPAEGEGNPA